MIRVATVMYLLVCALIAVAASWLADPGYAAHRIHIAILTSLTAVSVFSTYYGKLLHKELDAVQTPDFLPVITQNKLSAELDRRRSLYRKYETNLVVLHLLLALSIALAATLPIQGGLAIWFTVMGYAILGLSLSMAFLLRWLAGKLSQARTKLERDIRNEKARRDKLEASTRASSQRGDFSGFAATPLKLNERSVASAVFHQHPAPVQKQK